MGIFISRLIWVRNRGQEPQHDVIVLVMVLFGAFVCGMMCSFSYRELKPWEEQFEYMVGIGRPSPWTILLLMGQVKCTRWLSQRVIGVTVWYRVKKSWAWLLTIRRWMMINVLWAWWWILAPPFGTRSCFPWSYRVRVPMSQGEKPSTPSSISLAAA